VLKDRGQYVGWINPDLKAPYGLCASITLPTAWVDYEIRTHIASSNGGMLPLHQINQRIATSWGL